MGDNLKNNAVRMKDTNRFSNTWLVCVVLLYSAAYANGAMGNIWLKQRHHLKGVGYSLSV